MNTKMILYIIPLVIFLGVVLYGIFIVLRLKIRLNKMSKYADEVDRKLSCEGINDYYGSLESSELIDLYQKMFKEFDVELNAKEFQQSIELEKKMMIIKEILKGREIDLPDDGI